MACEEKSRENFDEGIDLLTYSLTRPFSQDFPNTVRLGLELLRFAFFGTDRIVCCRVYVTVRCPSVRLIPSVCPAASGGFAAVGPASRRYRSMAAATERRSSMAAGCGQCHVVSLCTSSAQTCLSFKFFFSFIFYYRSVLTRR